MADPVQDKRAELKAAAEGGRSGLAAYRSGQERVLSDQRAAIDLALDGAMSRGAPSAYMNQLTGIIKPVGDAAQGRLAAAGDRFAASSGSLGGALGEFKSGASRVEDLAYQYAKQQAQKALDKRKAGENALTQADIKNAAMGIGSEMQAEAMAKAQAQADEVYRQQLLDFAEEAFGDITFEKKRAHANKQLLNAQTPEDVLRIIRTYAPKRDIPKRNFVSQTLDNTFDKIGGVLGLDPSRTGPKPPARPGVKGFTDEQYNALLGDVAEFYDQDYAGMYAPVRQVEADRYLFNQQAAQAMGIDPYIAAGMFPQDMGFANDADSEAAIRRYVETGMTPDEYADYERSITVGADDALEAEKRRIAQEASLSDGLIQSTADKWSLDEIELYNTVQMSGAVIRGVLATAREALEAGAYAEDAEAGIRSSLAGELEGVDPQYRDAITAMALDQFEVFASPYFDGA